MRPALLLLLGSACSGTAPPCQPWQTDKSATTPIVHLADESPTGSVTVQIVIPSAERYPEGSPVAVWVHGGWTPDVVPLAATGGRLVSDQGFATVYFNLPGGSADDSSEGASDQRGQSARQALGAVLRYAAGEVMDDGRCTLSDRLPGGLSGEVVMAGSSNGGNLAWATAADTEVEIPVLSGIATFESPISSQMMTVEPGGEAEPAEFFRAGHCELDETLHMSCDHGYSHIAFDPSASEETDGVLFIDENDDQLLNPGESTLNPIFSPADDAWVHPTEALIAAADLPLVRRADASAAERFWAEREATQQLRGAAARFPSLAGIATGTEVDHILTGLELPVHITGLVSAMQSAALSWSRLHPDAAYVAQLTGFKEAQEYDADMALDVVEPLLNMEPEENSMIRGTDYFSAAVIEIMDRSHSGDWSADLGTPIVEHP
jgi:hypothetical protein